VCVRLGGVTLWRIQCPTCRAVFTVLPHFILRYRPMRPEGAREVLLAPYGGLSVELCAVIHHLSSMALYRLVCAVGHHSLVTRLTRCGLPLPTYVLADEKHSRCLPYQRRAQHAGQCGVEVEGGTVPTCDWFLNLQILTSGGFR
jgi:hypothetical protein